MTINAPFSTAEKQLLQLAIEAGYFNYLVNNNGNFPTNVGGRGSKAAVGVLAAVAAVANDTIRTGLVTFQQQQEATLAGQIANAQVNTTQAQSITTGFQTQLSTIQGLTVTLPS